MVRSFALAAFLGCSAAVVSGSALNWPECYCPIQVNDGTCYYTLHAAIAAAHDSDTINLYDDIVVYDEIQFNTSLKFIGHGTPRPRMDASMNLKYGGMLRVLGLHQTILLHNIDFGRLGDGLASVLRSRSAGLAAQPINPHGNYARLNLTVTDCTFKNFQTLDRGGAAMFISVSSYLRIENTEFSDNLNLYYTPKRWDGGGAVWIQVTQGIVFIKNTKFLRNRSLWKHGQGGGLMINYIAHNLHMEGVIMEENQAAGGGAVYLGTIAAHVTATVENSKFYKNNATEFGWKSRAGAMWVEYVHGKFIVKNSKFIGNHADVGRGGVFANNKILGHGLVSLHGEFIDNYSHRGGSIWDSLSCRPKTGGPCKPNDPTIPVFPSMRERAEIVIEAGSLLKGNHVTDHSPDVIIRIDKSSKRGIVYVQRNEYTGKTLTITNNLNNAPNVDEKHSKHVPEKPDPREAPKKA